MHTNNLCLASLLNHLPDPIPPCLLSNHNLEPSKIIQIPPLLHIRPLLCPRALIPLLDCTLLLEVFFDDA